MACYLGIDGGGTKTAFALADEAGNILAVRTLGGASYKQLGTDGVGRILSDGIAALCDAAGKEGQKRGDDFFVCMGLPNYGESASADIGLHKLAEKILPQAKTFLVNDAEVGWAGSLLLETGINIVAGTGSIAYGKNDKGETARAGGWSEWFSDEGSCRWLGMKCMEIFTKEADGRKQKGALYELVRKRFGLERDSSVIDLFEQQYLPFRDKIASLQRLLMEAALQKDPAACEAYGEAAEELSAIVCALYRRLEFNGVCPVSYSGGLFQSGSLILDPLEEKLRRMPGGGVTLVRPKAAPVLGAVLLAKFYGDEKRPSEEFVQKVVREAEKPGLPQRKDEERCF